MKVIVQEYGAVAISMVTGGCVIGIGIGMCDMIRPMIEKFLEGIM